VTEIGRISVVMHISNQLNCNKLQKIKYRDSRFENIVGGLGGKMLKSTRRTN